jgi:hypothetical protein
VAGGLLHFLKEKGEQASPPRARKAEDAVAQKAEEDEGPGGRTE